MPEQPLPAASVRGRRSSLGDDTECVIRKAGPGDLRRIQDIEAAASELFRAIGMDSIADDTPVSLTEPRAYQCGGKAWVATDAADHPIAYILVEVADTLGAYRASHSPPHHSRQGLGRDLIDHVARWAQGSGISGITLTSFRDVPWNAPYYERLRFARLAEREWPDAPRQTIKREHQHGLDAWPRVVMTKRINPEANAL